MTKNHKFFIHTIIFVMYIVTLEKEYPLNIHKRLGMDL